MLFLIVHLLYNYELLCLLLTSTKFHAKKSIFKSFTRQHRDILDNDKISVGSTDNSTVNRAE